MKYILPITIIILFIVTIILLIIKIRQANQSVREQYVKHNEAKWAAITAREEAAYNKLVEDRQKMEADNARRATELQSLIQTRQTLTKETIASIDAKKEAYVNSLKDYEEVTRKALDDKIWQYFQNEKNAYNADLQKIVEEMRGTALVEYEALVSTMQEQLGALQHEVDDYRQKRDAINAEILRQRALDEQQDFYRICITDADLEDIDILLSLRQRLHKSSFLDKITYDTFVSKYVKEMAKRVLEGKDPSGIYKVTNIKTNEVYVGKSTTVATRWQNHTKSAFGLEGVADSQFQRALKKYGIQNFTWALLEEVPKDKLTEREKYYIDLYDTTKYGYNMRNG